LLAFLMLRTQSLYRAFQIWRPMERPDWPAIGHFARLGLPGGLAYLVEVTSFTLMALFIARQGIEASASHQIAASLAAVLYMLPLSMAIACSARVSFWLGAGKPALAKRVVLLGLKLTAIISIELAATLWIASNYLASLYSSNPAIIAIAASLLGWVAFYHLADSAQAVCAFLLRCYGVTVAPLMLYGVLLWGLGLFGGYQLSYEGLAGLAARPEPASFWAVSTLALGLVALGLMGLLWRAVGKSQRTSTAKTSGV
jgi:MATE family multidrug resistance protein